MHIFLTPFIGLAALWATSYHDAFSVFRPETHTWSCGNYSYVLLSSLCFPNHPGPTAQADFKAITSWPPGVVYREFIYKFIQTYVYIFRFFLAIFWLFGPVLVNGGAREARQRPGNSPGMISDQVSSISDIRKRSYGRFTKTRTCCWGGVTCCGRGGQWGGPKFRQHFGTLGLYGAVVGTWG